LIALSVVSGNDTSPTPKLGRHQHIVFGDEPFRASIMENGPTYVYEGVTGKDGTPQWEPAVLYDPHNDAGNQSLVSFTQREINELSYRGETVAQIRKALRSKGLDLPAANAIAALIHRVANEGDSPAIKSYWHNDSMRWTFNFAGPL
jgi:hypothetical protein